MNTAVEQQYWESVEQETGKELAEMVKNSGVRYVTKGALEGGFGDGRVARALGIIFVGTEVGCDGHISTTGITEEPKARNTRKFDRKDETECRG